MDFEEILKIRHPTTGNFCCVGCTTKNKRCTKPIAAHNIQKALVILRYLPQVCRDEERLRSQLEQLAGFALCRGYHQGQVAATVEQWSSTIDVALADTNPKSEPSRDLVDEIAKLQRELDGSRRCRERERRREQQSSRGEEGCQREARRQAEADATEGGEHRREEIRRGPDDKAGREEARRQQDARREDEARAKEEQARRQRANAPAPAEGRSSPRERAAREWAEAWTRYERDWGCMPQLKTSDLDDDDVRGSVPWPVKSGRWQDVDDRNVPTFLLRAPDGAHGNPRKFRSVLRRQAMRWHEDRLRRCFPWIVEDGESARLANVVMQIVKGLSDYVASL